MTARAGLDQSALATRLAALRTYRETRRADVTILARCLRRSSDHALFRINPYLFATDHGLPAATVVDLFVRAVKVGVVDLSWNTVCVWCGAVEYTHDSLNGLPRRSFQCTMCHSEMGANLDDRTEVTFTVNRAVRTVAPDPFASLAAYLRHFHSPSFVRSQAFLDYLDRSILGHALVPPDAARTITFVAQPGRSYRLMSFDLHSNVIVRTGARAAAGATRLEIDAVPSGLSATQRRVPAGDVRMTVRNRLDRPCGAVLLDWDEDEYHTLAEHHAPARTAYLTGKQLLNSQTFRSLFRVHDLDADLRLNIKSLTLLFTDLRGSTELYERTGDAAAYAIVSRHFHVLARIIARFHGAIVKTMGDAIMASFSGERDGVQAAFAMERAVGQLNASLKAKGNELGLKVGLHEGPALVVNADQRVDYFGQTVNLAARVQALAQAGEICMTEPVYQHSGADALLRDLGYRGRREAVQLKGIGAPTVIYRFVRD